MSLSYKKSGVNYDLLDPVKRLAQVAGLKTANNILGLDFREISTSRGETAYVLEAAECYHAFVQEGLGTKNLVADEMRKITGKTYYETIAQDTVAMIINDLITVGARPLSILAYWAVGNSGWFADKKRNNDLVNGWKKACDL
ncbi:phosphoribosylformylglycinamidine cyclo-ligase, partial [Candidatus Gottesmanbacteria bacterium]|nr:phosphoribosylformylglycinamidine cyclo-ligase [Candidatus Gottesmanbacteria bacterium]